MTRPDAVDIHAHYFPEAFLDLCEREGGAAGVRVDRSDPKGPRLLGGGGRTPPLDATYWDLDRRVKYMDRRGVRVHALSLTSPMVYWADSDLGARLARAVNDAMEQAHRAYPERFVGCATLPMQDAKAALAELERVTALRGIRGVYLGTNIAGRDLSDPAFRPLFARCQAARLPVLLHPLTVIGAPRLQPYYLSNLLGNPFDTAVAAAHFVFGGILDEFPRLEVCLPHAGGALPALFGRLGHGQRVRPEARTPRKPFAAYLRRFTYDTISHSPQVLAYLVSLVGADRIMVGSDHCFDMGYQRPREVVTRGMRLRRADQARVLHGTASRLLRLT
ncbi:MAG TPA: amidohydrolase family protein [Methylomirabilota bacterium]|nr:amidohydrolase family protein [Methylomirabilota bacterium]